MPPRDTFLNNNFNQSVTTPTTALPPPPAPPLQFGRRENLSSDDLQMLRNVLFSEVSNRNPDRQAFEARLITNTALNRIPQYAAKGERLTLSGVLTKKNQYQGYGSKEYNRIMNNATTTSDSQKLAAIDGVINELRTGNLLDTAQGRVFYHHDPSGKIWLKDGGLYK